MHLDSSQTTVKGKTYRRHLLRESYREDGKVKHRTIANVSACSPEEIEAIRLALRHKGNLQEALAARPELRLLQGLSIGAVWTVFDVARRLGIVQALGDAREGRLALWQVIARVIAQGSRLSAVRLAGVHAACDVLGLGGFNEDDLYANLDWLCERQEAIEKHLSRERAGKGGLFLYDVTSSYLEGACNELGAFGYNRDGKRGKKQIVIGLLCNEEGDPLSVEVFPGNTQDTRTMASQVRKAAERFGGGEVTFVGDRGMIKTAQIEDLGREGFHYITAITKAQIATLLAKGTIQMDLFDLPLAEVREQSGERYVLRRNPVRAGEMETSRGDKFATLAREAERRNAYLAAHPRARVATALAALRRRAERLRIGDWAEIAGDEETRAVTLTTNKDARADAAKLDGCYVLKTDLAAEAASKETVHGRYKDLALVEKAFRTSKTVQLELRPIHVRLATRTRGHVFVVMLAYRIVRELGRCWSGLDTTVQEGLNEL
ncbi:MAG: IS1634 family transposase, partial [Chloroflexales bacterium]